MNKFFDFFRSMKKRNQYTLLIIGIMATIFVSIYLLQAQITANSSQLDKFFAHPFVLLVSGAMISSILIPFFNRRSQDRKKKLEIKLDLANRISEVSTLAIAIALKIGDKDVTSDQAACMLKAKSVEVTMWTYFPEIPIADEWIDYVDMLATFWSLTGFLTDKKYEQCKSLVSDLKKYIDKIHEKNEIKWEELQTKDYQASWRILKTSLFNHFRYFVISVVKSPIKIFE